MVDVMSLSSQHALVPAEVVVYLKQPQQPRCVRFIVVFDGHWVCRLAFPQQPPRVRQRRQPQKRIRFMNMASKVISSLSLFSANPRSHKLSLHM